MERQKEWEQRFTEQLQKREQAHADSSWLQSMPQHCVQESRAKVTSPCCACTCSVGAGNP